MSTAYCAETENIVYSEHSRRDPFVPLNLSKDKANFNGLDGVESVNDLSLEGVVVDRRNGSIAIVNGIVLNEGQTEGTVKVLKISEDGVTFEIKGRSEFKPFSADEAPTQAFKEDLQAS